VIKFITVRMDEEEKRLAKVKAARGVRRQTGTPAAAAAPAPVAVPALWLPSPVAAAPAEAAPEAAEPLQASA